MKSTESLFIMPNRLVDKKVTEITFERNMSLPGGTFRNPTVVVTVIKHLYSATQ